MKTQQPGPGRDSVWLLDEEPSGHLIVFVHGYRGHAVSTWGGFRYMLRDHPRLDGVDLLFWGYLTQQRARLCAVRFLNLLREYMKERERAGRPWTRVSLVAHSMGAVVCRQAMVEAIEAGDAWPQITSTYLFAPAHCGARLQDVASNLPAEKYMGPWFAAWRNFADPALLDLEEGSPFLSKLSRDAERLIATDAGEPLIAELVVHGGLDFVVSPNRFVRDPVPHIVDGAGHFAVCKPGSKDFGPLELLMRSLFGEAPVFAPLSIRALTDGRAAGDAAAVCWIAVLHGVLNPSDPGLSLLLEAVPEDHATVSPLRHKVVVGMESTLSKARAGILRVPVPKHDIGLHFVQFLEFSDQFDGDKAVDALLQADERTMCDVERAVRTEGTSLSRRGEQVVAGVHAGLGFSERLLAYFRALRAAGAPEHLVDMIRQYHRTRLGKVRDKCKALSDLHDEEVSDRRRRSRQVSTQSETAPSDVRARHFDDLLGGSGSA